MSLNRLEFCRCSITYSLLALKLLSNLRSCGFCLRKLSSRFPAFCCSSTNRNENLPFSCRDLTEKLATSVQCLLLALPGSAFSSTLVGFEKAYFLIYIFSILFGLFGQRSSTLTVKPAFFHSYSLIYSLKRVFNSSRRDRQTDRTELCICSGY